MNAKLTAEESCRQVLGPLDNQENLMTKSTTHRITRQSLRDWGACYSDERIAELVPDDGVTPRQVVEAEQVPFEDRLWVLASIRLPEGPSHARLAVIVREAGRHGSPEICERVAMLCDRVAAGESRASLEDEFRDARAQAAEVAKEAKAAAWAAEAKAAKAWAKAAWAEEAWVEAAAAAAEAAWAAESAWAAAWAATQAAKAATQVAWAAAWAAEAAAWAEAAAEEATKEEAWEEARQRMIKGMLAVVEGVA